MVPPIRTRNLILGREFFHWRQALPATQELETSLDHRLRDEEGNRRSQGSDAAARRLLTLGYPRLRPEPPVASSEPELQARIQALLREARDGNRLGYLEALRANFALLQRNFAALQETDPLRAFRLAAPNLEPCLRNLRGSQSLAEEYARHIQGGNYSQEQRLTYYFAAAREIRVLLGSLLTEAPDRQEFRDAASQLRNVLLDYHRRMAACLAGLAAEAPQDRRFDGLSLELRMRSALLQGDRETARLRLAELQDHYRAHPPPAEDENDPETLRFYHQAARDFLAEPDLGELSHRLDLPSAEENGVEAMNALTIQLLAVAGLVHDRLHEVETGASLRRQRTLTLVLASLARLHPGSAIKDLMQILGDASQDGELAARIGREAARSTVLARLLESLGGAANLRARLQEARGALNALAAAGRPEAGNYFFLGCGVLRELLSRNQEQNPLERLAHALYYQPELQRQFGQTPSRDHDALLALARNLFRRVPSALQGLQDFAAAHPEADLRHIRGILEEGHSPQALLQNFTEDLLDSLITGHEERSDLETAMTYSLAQFLAGEREYAPGLRLEEGLRRRVSDFRDNMEGTEFRLRRALAHLFSTESLLTLTIGILIADTVPLLLVDRAGTAGRLSLPVLGDLVTAGRITDLGLAASGMVSGLGIAISGDYVESQAREAAGLPGQFWERLPRQAAASALTFGALLPLSRRWNLFTERMTVGGAEWIDTELTRSFLQETGGILLSGALSVAPGLVLRGGRSGGRLPQGEELFENILTITTWRLGAGGYRYLRRQGPRAFRNFLEGN
ncbi:MAG: hypothetical protein U1F66_01620 [bacterium]